MSSDKVRQFDFIGRVFKSRGIDCAICGNTGPGWERNHPACEEKAREDILYALLEMLEISEKDRIRERQSYLDKIMGLARMWDEQARINPPDNSVVASMYRMRARDLRDAFSSWQSCIDGARLLAKECIQDFRRRVLKEVGDPRFMELADLEDLEGGQES